MIAICRPCKLCGKPRPSQRSAYCSEWCSLEAISRQAVERWKQNRTAETRVCFGCNEPFFCTNRKQRFCSQQCQSRARYARGTGRTRYCRACHEPYQPKMVGRDSFCSRACNYNMMRKIAGEREVLHRWAKRNWKAPPPPVCVDCGDAINVRKRCKPCERQRARMIQRRRYEVIRVRLPSHKGCVDCAGMFLVQFSPAGRRSSARLCPTCSLRKVREYKQNQNGLRRARKRGNGSIMVLRKEIFKRDGYRCQRCGAKTRPDYKPTHRLYPELDHIIPIVLGGPHVPENTECLWRQCNNEKASSTKGTQMRLSDTMAPSILPA